MAGDFLFPPAVPRLARQIAVGDGHLLYVEECGPADGLPVVFLHGGPGSGCTPLQRRLFDPQRFRAILIDQRGAGRSLPLGELAANSTPHLVADLEAVRDALGIERWIVFGGSWGSLLAMAYAQLFPERVLGLVLRGIFLGSAHEIEAYVQGWQWGAGRIFGHFYTSTAALDFLAATVLGDDREQALAAARSWLDHECTCLGESPLEADPNMRQLAKVTIQLHYLRRHCFLAPGSLLAGIEHIRHLPAAIVQGMHDPVCPPETASTLHRAWPEATWVPVADAGHGGLEPPIARACIKALDWVAGEVALSSVQ